MREKMEESPVVQEDPPASLPLQCVLKENESSDMQWQEFSDKVSAIQNSRLLFLTVEYVQNAENEMEFNNISSDISENDRISPFDSNLNSSERYSQLYNTLVIPSDDQSQFQNSVVVLPSSRTDSRQISIVVDHSQVRQQLVIESNKEDYNQEISNNLKLNSETSQIIVNQESDFVTQMNREENGSNLGQKLIISAAPGVVLSQDSISDSVCQNPDILTAGSAFFPDGGNKLGGTHNFVADCNSSIQNGFPPPSPNETVLLSETAEKESKTLLASSKYIISHDNLKPDELLLSDSDQNSELLLKSEALMEVDSYNLTQENYITPEDNNSYQAMEDQLNINNIEKGDNEYLLHDTMTFADGDSNILQSNLEVFTSQVLDSNGLLMYDKSRLRSIKKHPAEHLGFEYWCEDCEFGMKCRRHEVKVVSDKPVLSRARATLPKELLAINKLNGETSEEGVFARKTIMRRVQFGPVEGQLIKEWENFKENDPNAVDLLLEVETGHLLKLDVSNENESNWMRFVRKAQTSKEQNLILTQQGKSLYFITTRVIPPRQELKVGYSPQYGERRKLRVLEDHSWSCFECTANFSSAIDLQKHLNVHENERDSKEKSGKRRSRNLGFRGISNVIRRRANKNRNGRENECWSCHKIFPRTYSLKRHMMLVHSEKDKENSGVLKNFNERNEKLIMANTLFKKKHSNGTGSEWLCTHCNLTFDNPSVLNLHTLTHAAEDLESETVLGLPSELSSVYHEGEFLIENGDVQCPQCTQEFSSKRELIDHVSTHGKMTLKKFCSNPSKPFKCDQCYKSFATDSRLQKHMLVHGSEETKPYQCSTCSKRFLNNSALCCHLKTHNEKKSFECPLCKKEFEQVFGLKEHVKIHSTDGFFTCPHCNKVLEGYSLIRKHIRVFHSGHQHACKDCGKLCPTLDKLRMHSLKHSDHREFLCANCGKQFKRKDKLKEHMKRMHSIEREMKMSLALRIPDTKDRKLVPKMSPLAYDRFIYKCRNCMVGFKRRGMLVNHLAKRHPDIVPDTVPELNLPILKTTRDYFCQYCDKIYKSSSKRKAHILKNHPGAELPMSNRQKGGIPQIPGVPNPTFSKTVGSVKTTPHGCEWCHKQYASKAKLLQHQRKKHPLLVPQSQQNPKLSKNPSSPVGGKITENSTTFTQVEKWKEDKKLNVTCAKFNEENTEQIVQAVFNESEDMNRDVNSTYKKPPKGVAENIPCELLHQAMTELNQSLSDYKLSFSGTQEALLKIIGLKEGGEGASREDTMPAAQMTRTWPDLPPYPPR